MKRYSRLAISCMIAILSLCQLHAQNDYYEYNIPVEAGPCDSVQYDQWNVSDWATQQYTVRRTDSQQLISEELYYDASGEVQQKVVFKRDTGVISEVATYFDNGTELTKYYQTDIAYAANGKMEAQVQKVYDLGLNEFVNQQRISTTHDASDKRTASTYEYWDGQQWVASSRTNYRYDANGRLTSATIQYFSSGKWADNSRVEYAYTANGKLETEIQQYKNGTEWTDNYMIANVYDASDILLTKSYSYVTQSGWYLYQVDSFMNALEYTAYTVDMSTGTYHPLSRKVCANLANANPPAAPMFLFVQLKGAAKAELFWYENATNENGFLLERSMDSVQWDLVDSIAADVEAYLDEGLSPETEYFYRVAAYNETGPSAYVYASITTGKAAIPIVPIHLNVSIVTVNSVDIYWFDSSDNEAGFIIERSLDKINWSILDSTEVNNSYYSDYGLTVNTTYHYRVASYNEYGVSDFSNIVTAVTKDPVPPAEPGELSAQLSGTEDALLEWEDQSDNEDGFIIQRSTNGFTWNMLDLTGPGTTSYMDAGLSNGTYYYRIAAYNTIGQSDWSNIANVEVGGNEPPAAPMFLGAIAISSSEITLGWLSLAQDVIGFRIQRSLDGNSWNALAMAPAGIPVYQDQGLQASTTYYYRIAAFNSNGQSDWSNVASATTMASTTPPDAPNQLTAIAYKKQDDGKVELNWKDNSTDEDGFIVFRSLDNMNWNAIETLAVNITTFHDEGLVNETTYHYKVVAFNGNGLSAYSNTVHVQTLTGIENIDTEGQLSIYPNPAISFVSVKLNKDTHNARLRILDINGRIVHRMNLTITESQIDISHLSPGTYVIEVITDDTLYNSTLIKQ